MQRIKKGDTVEIIAGKDVGVRGEVIEVYPKDNRVIIGGANVMKKHQKARQAGSQQIPAQIVEFNAPMDLSNVMLVCPDTDQPTRVGFRFNEAGRKVRFSKRSGKDIE